MFSAGNQSRTVRNKPTVGKTLSFQTLASKASAFLRWKPGDVWREGKEGEAAVTRSDSDCRVEPQHTLHSPEEVLPKGPDLGIVRSELALERWPGDFLGPLDSLGAHAA